MHVPLTHVCAPGQTVPQALQLFLSQSLLVQTPVQLVVPDGQPLQEDAVHTCRAL